MKFTKISSSEENQELRREYLQSLPEPQEFFLENCISQADGWLISIDGQNEGYFYIFDDVIFEFYFRSPYIEPRVKVLQKVLLEFNINQLNCKSFDAELMSTAFFLQPSVSAVGLMFREYDAGSYVQRIKLVPICRRAEKKDVQEVWGIHQDFFDSMDEIEQYIQENGLFLFLADREIIGCGVVSKISQFVDAYDIGMVVNPKYRKQGYGSYIVHTIAERCFKNNQRPVCGCEINNIASYKTLEKAGFHSKHQILRFSLQ